MHKYLLFLAFFAWSNLVKADDEAFLKWKKQYIKKAASRGIPSHFLNTILDSVVLDHSIIEKDKTQITSNTEVDYQVWIKTWLRENPSRIEVAKEMMKEHLPLLKEIEKKYQVDKEVIVALWGVESLFGKIQGEYDLVNSLATLSYEGRRRSFFEIQLTAALRLIYKGHVTRENLKGSWAGATGQCQFMPSNIPGYAVDYNKDGKKDIWNTTSDVFASIAHLLQKSGWEKGKSIGSLAMPTKDISKVDFTIYRSPKRYNDLGFTNLNGGELSGKWRRMAEKIPMKNSPFVLRGANYAPLRKWNRSSLFAAFNIILVDALKNSK